MSAIKMKEQPIKKYKNNHISSKSYKQSTSRIKSNLNINFYETLQEQIETRSCSTLVGLQGTVHVQKHHTTDYVLYTSHEGGHESESISSERRVAVGVKMFCVAKAAVGGNNVKYKNRVLCLL